MKREQWWWIAAGVCFFGFLGLAFTPNPDKGTGPTMDFCLLAALILGGVAVWQSRKSS